MIPTGQSSDGLPTPESTDAPTTDPEGDPEPVDREGTDGDERGERVERDGDDEGGERHIPVEISVATDGDERPPVDDVTRVDVEVDGQMYPTARLADGRYVAWWFDTEAPELDDPATTEWVAAPTRFLAAGTLHELWQDPGTFDRLAGEE